MLLDIWEIKFFFLKDDLTPVKCKSFLFPECKYETGYVFLYIENFRKQLSLLLHWRSTTPGYTWDKLTPWANKIILFWRLAGGIKLDEQWVWSLDYRNFPVSFCYKICFDYGCLVKWNVGLCFSNSGIVTCSKMLAKWKCIVLSL